MPHPSYVAYIDESGTSGPVFVVGALLAKPDRWLAFADEWRTVLAAPPAIPRFHLSDPQGLSPEDHQRKIDELTKVINKYVERGDLVVIHVDQYKAIFGRKIGITRDNPLFQGYIHMMAQCACFLPDTGAKIDLVFDYIDNTHYLEVLDVHRRFKQI